jgi:L-aminopeptidase/D-esterase-like protein
MRADREAEARRRHGRGDVSPDLSGFGIAVGHATDSDGATGLTVIRGISGPIRAAVSVFGRAVGSRDLLAASPFHVTGGRVDAILLTGGSAYGLDAASGVMRWMEEHGRGYAIGGGVVPIVPAAVIFDLAPLGSFRARPTPAMAYAATNDATSIGVAEGSVGAGTGATVGKLAGSRRAMKGGFGYAVCSGGTESGTGVSVAAFAVVNALGDVRDRDGHIIAGARDERGEFLDPVRGMIHENDGGIAAASSSAPGAAPDVRAMQNTTLAVVASSVPLDGVALMQLAQASGAALFRRITPAGSTFDGDVVFAIAPDGPPAVMEPIALEAVAVEALERAIERAVRTARGRDGTPGLADVTDGD